MLPYPLSEIEESHLAGLVSGKVPEGKTIEYKSDLPGGSDTDKKEFLKDVSAFANTDGGDIIYGVTTADGQLLGFTGIGDDAVPDEIILRLENLARDGIAPRLPRLEMRAVEGFGVTMLVVRVHKSWSAPHRVVFGGHGHFYGRNSAGAFQMDVGQLRNAFALSESVTERMRGFIATRRRAILDGDPVMRLGRGCAQVLHIVPVSAFAGESRIDIAPNLESLKDFHPLGRDGYQNSRINLEGIVTFANLADGRTNAYTQVWRSGVVEAVAVFPMRDEPPPAIHAPTYEKRVRLGAKRYLAKLQQLNVPPPFILFVSFLNANGYSFLTGLGEWGEAPTKADRNVLEVPEVILMDFGASLDQVLRPVFDTVWNAFGHEKCAYFNAAGEYASTG
jgi:hypothetical protein